MGLFTWWCIVDQRLSIWTTLIGPTVAIVMTLLVLPSFGLVYLLWIMSTRLIASGLLGLIWGRVHRSEEHTSELQSLMRISYAVLCLKNKKRAPAHRSPGSMTTGRYVVGATFLPHRRP